MIQFNMPEEFGFPLSIIHFSRGGEFNGKSLKGFSKIKKTKKKREKRLRRLSLKKKKR